MNTHDPNELLAVPRRQSPIAAVFHAVSLLRNLGIGQALALGVLLFNVPIPGGALLLIPLVAIVWFGFSLVAWWRFTFVVEHGELRIARGVIAEDRLSIPLERIQSVSIEQGFLNRLLGLVRLEVETAGTTDTELEIHAIARDVADALARVAADTKASHMVMSSVEAVVLPNGELREPDVLPPPPPVADRVLVDHDPRRLVRVALSQWPFAGLVVLLPILVVGEEISGPLGDPLASIRDVEVGTTAIVLLGLLAVIVGAVGVNLVQVFFFHWELELVASENGLRKRSGLVSKYGSASSVARLQQFAKIQNPLQRRVGLWDVSLDLIGDQMVIHGCDATQVDAIESIVLGDESIDRANRTISPLSVFPAVRNGALAAVVAGVVLYLTQGIALAWIPVFVPPAVWVFERYRQRRFRWGFHRGTIVTARWSVLGSSTAQMLVRKTNGVEVHQSRFERRRNLATVRVHTAGSSMVIGMIDSADAWALRDILLDVVETDSRTWM